MKRMAVPRARQVVETPEGIEINTGPLQVSLDRRRCNGLSRVDMGGRAIIAPNHGGGGAYFVTDDGQSFRACAEDRPTVAIESQGPLRLILEARSCRKWSSRRHTPRRCARRWCAETGQSAKSEELVESVNNWPAAARQATTLG